MIDYTIIDRVNTSRLAYEKLLIRLCALHPRHKAANGRVYRAFDERGSRSVVMPGAGARGTTTRYVRIA